VLVELGSYRLMFAETAPTRRGRAAQERDDNQF
jgi:hypothetical protein